MAFDRPDLKTLISRTVTDITSRFTTTNNLLRRMVARVFGRVLAGLAMVFTGTSIGHQGRFCQTPRTKTFCCATAPSSG